MNENIRMSLCYKGMKNVIVEDVQVVVDINIKVSRENVLKTLYIFIKVSHENKD